VSPTCTPSYNNWGDYPPDPNGGSGSGADGRAVLPAVMPIRQQAQRGFVGRTGFCGVDDEHLTAADVAETVAFIASVPRHVNLTEITILPTQQAV
jgi:hypothetical protein